MKMFAVANADETAYYTYGHKDKGDASLALAFAKAHDHGAHIVELEIETPDEKIERLMMELEQVKRELNAAMADINMCCPCEVCTRSCTYDKVNPYDECADFEWRGLPEPPEEET